MTGPLSAVTITRLDLLALPVPETNLLWRDLHVRKVRKESGKQTTHNIRVDICFPSVLE